jgi:putative DNA primase/helicase
MTDDIIADNIIDGDEQAPAFSEESIALRFAELHADALRYVAKWNQWFMWDGSCWRVDQKKRILSLVRALCREVSCDANSPKLARTIASGKTRAAVAGMAGEDRRLAASVDQWDSDPWLLNTPAGVVDLHTGKMREHRPEDYLTKQCAASPGGKCPQWKKFMQEITGDDIELQRYLQRVSGYCLTGVTNEQELFFLYGTGNNGKGVFTLTLSGILGDYHTAT